MGKSAVRHFFWPVAAFCVFVSLWVGWHNPALGVGAFSTFFSILLFSGQLTTDQYVSTGFRTWSRKDQLNFVLSLMAAVITGIAYLLALPTMFKCA
ncbi:hypothetical protein C1X34_33370 [Pseudomonas sp. GW456-12-10-14-TSB6]|nr:hypothetical protein C1X55_31270 [Pseudomonas sp. GW460-C8]PMW23284.1 hypothetical protein C1X53_12020 [Pseudomonas sp. GW456-E6]PMW24240.1 hypothetical protein C1X40_05365 [Pseudomonas sp. GW456-11-11-14-TSB2]PMW40134.1 hypothetical protein C1X45_08675 [Pseudomonas sp. GW460-7]PMW41245.1 hypothetical protein C1X48_07310 [Pseudomonas sp. FW305-3-2-15-A-R2A1]PMW53699.1 hypothetical protein C1X31_29180 [Pseudomonas sp. GW456-11-11-14-LB2]PMW62837.1 hypothetical protein C1X39_04295 [Pseudomon